MKQLFYPRFYDVSILERLRTKAANYKINLNSENPAAALASADQINDRIRSSKNIELAMMKDKETKSNLINDKKSSTKSSNHTSNIVRPFVQDENEKMNNNNNNLNKYNKCDNSNPFAAGSQDVSENNYLNESDRKKLIMTNDISQLENKSDILQNLGNSTLKGFEAFEKNEANINNQSFGKTKSICDENNEIKGKKLFTDNNDDDVKSHKSRKEKKEKKLRNEINKIDLMRDDKVKKGNLTKKPVPETDEEIIMDFDMDVLGSEEEDDSNKRLRKVKFNDKVKKEEDKIQDNEKNKNIISNKEEAENVIEILNKKESKNEFLFEIKEEIYIDDELQKKSSKESQIVKSKNEKDVNNYISNKNIQEPVEILYNRSRSILKNRKINLSEVKEIDGKLNINKIKEDQNKAAGSFISFPSQEINEKTENFLTMKAEENKDSKKEDNVEITVPSEFNKDSFGEGGKINNISDTVLKKNMMQ